jgi:hypothetical protein
MFREQEWPSKKWWELNHNNPQAILDKVRDVSLAVEYMGKNKDLVKQILGKMLETLYVQIQRLPICIPPG